MCAPVCYKLYRAHVLGICTVIDSEVLDSGVVDSEVLDSGVVDSEVLIIML